MRLRIHHDGRTASGLGDGGRRGRSASPRRACRRNAVRVAPRRPRLGRARTTGRSWHYVSGRCCHRRRDAGRSGARSCGRSSTAPAAWTRPGYCRTNHWSGGFANSAGQALTGEAVECGMSGIARLDGADGVARHAPAPPGRAGRRASLGARAAAKARASDEAGRAARRSLRGRARAGGRRRHRRRPRRTQGSTARRSTSDARSYAWARTSSTRPSRLVDDPLVGRLRLRQRRHAASAARARRPRARPRR